MNIYLLIHIKGDLLYWLIGCGLGTSIMASLTGKTEKPLVAQAAGLDACAISKYLWSPGRFLESSWPSLYFRVLKELDLLLTSAAEQATLPVR